MQELPETVDSKQKGRPVLIIQQSQPKYVSFVWKILAAQRLLKHIFERAMLCLRHVKWAGRGRIILTGKSGASDMLLGVAPDQSIWTSGQNIPATGIPSSGKNGNRGEVENGKQSASSCHGGGSVTTFNNSGSRVAALTGAMMRSEVVVEPDLVWEWHTATGVGCSGRGNQSLSTVRVPTGCHTLIEENQCPPP